MEKKNFAKQAMKMGGLSALAVFAVYQGLMAMYLLILSIVSDVVPRVELRPHKLIEDRIEFIVYTWDCMAYPAPDELRRCMEKWRVDKGACFFSVCEDKDEDRSAKTRGTRATIPGPAPVRLVPDVHPELVGNEGEVPLDLAS